MNTVVLGYILFPVLIFVFILYSLNGLSRNNISPSRGIREGISGQLLKRPEKLFEFNKGILRYPYQDISRYQNEFPKIPKVFPLRAVGEISEYEEPPFEQGIVYYVYSNGRCSYKNHFVMELYQYAKLVKSMTPSLMIALVSNCNLHISVLPFIDILIPVHPADLVHNNPQFYTRVLYNSITPFKITLALDVHTTFCDPRDPFELFSLFSKEQVDLTYSIRHHKARTASGFAMLYKMSPTMFTYWKDVTKFMVFSGSYGDDQYSITEVMTKKVRAKFMKFGLIRNDWFFATHQVDKAGEFNGLGRCYRASVPVHQRVKFIHAGTPALCKLMNGEHHEYENKSRIFLGPSQYSDCTFSEMIGTQLVFSTLEFIPLVAPYKHITMDWKPRRRFFNSSLFTF